MNLQYVKESLRLMTLIPPYISSVSCGVNFLSFFEINQNFTKLWLVSLTILTQTVSLLKLTILVKINFEPNRDIILTPKSSGGFSNVKGTKDEKKWMMI